jgi:1-acyl-sn-glycerol-3-phosphate acyltransferase
MNQKLAAKLIKTSIGYNVLKYCFGFSTFWLCQRRIKVVGRHNIPNNEAFIYALSHKNSLMDAVGVVFSQKHQPVFVARADAFANKTITKILHFMKILPIFRKRNTSNTVDNNAETFALAVEVLKHNKSIGIMPEGFFMPEYTIETLQKGIFRIAMAVKDDNNQPKNVKIIPVGLSWESRQHFYKDVKIIYGEAMDTSQYFEIYQENEAKAMRMMQNDLQKRMQKTLSPFPKQIDNPANEKGFILKDPQFKLSIIFVIYFAIRILVYSIALIIGLILFATTLKFLLLFLGIWILFPLVEKTILEVVFKFSNH